MGSSYNGTANVAAFGESDGRSAIVQVGLGGEIAFDASTTSDSVDHRPERCVSDFHGDLRQSINAGHRRANPPYEMATPSDAQTKTDAQNLSVGQKIFTGPLTATGNCHCHLGRQFPSLAPAFDNRKPVLVRVSRRHPKARFPATFDRHH